MDDALVVGLFQGFGDLARDDEAFADGERTSSRRSASVGPSTSSMTSARTPSASSSPKIEAIFGW